MGKGQTPVGPQTQLSKGSRCRVYSGQTGYGGLGTTQTIVVRHRQDHMRSPVDVTGSFDRLNQKPPIDQAGLTSLLVISTYVNGNAQTPPGRFVVHILYYKTKLDQFLLIATALEQQKSKSLYATSKHRS